MNDTFNPLDWIEPDPKPSKDSDQSQYAGTHAPSPMPPASSQSFNPSVHQSISCEVDTVISRIESSLTDITTSYPDWLNVGFALANEFGESGRGFFHRVSRFYSGYTKTDTDKQFDQCLKSTPSSRCITIKTFFHLAKQAGIDVKGHGARSMEQGDKSMGHGARSMEQGDKSMGHGAGGMEQGDKSMEYGAWDMEGAGSMEQSHGAETHAPELPTLPDAIFDQLPDFLQKVVEGARSREERDILLLGALGVLSACLPKLSGIYDEKKVFANLYLFITAQASAGKGSLTFCKQLANPIHWELRQELKRKLQVYDMEMREYNMAKVKDPNAEKPIKPPELMLYIPANNSATGVFQILADNDGHGLIFETEGDTMTQAFKSDHGNYSDGFRKAYHHEIISYYRRTDHEYREIIRPCVSTVLSGTPKQVSALIPSAENGLFSRFIFYHVNIGPLWKNVFVKRKSCTREEHFDNLGQEFFELYKTLRDQPDMQFCLTEEQEEEFNRFFAQLQGKYLVLQGTDYIATVRRLGLIAFRMAMIFTGLRIMETGDFTQNQVCSDDDFHNAMAMVKVLVKHSSYVFSLLPEDVKTTKPKDKKEQFFDALPETFNRREFLEVAKSIGISERTAQGYISKFCEKVLILHQQHDSYIKLNFTGTENEINPNEN